MGLKTVTIVFCDLVASTAMAQRLGDDAAGEVRRRCFDSWREVVEAHEGEVVRLLGDGLMAAFGSATAAIEAAIELQRATAHIARDHEGAAARVGISTGDASREDGDYYGSAVIEASRLCEHADVGQILASEAVRMLSRARTDAPFEVFGDLDLKGFDESSRVHTIGWRERGRPSVPFPALLVQSRREGFVGRSQAWKRLEAVYGEALENGARVAMLVGEPGVGKTRLAAEFCADVSDRGAVVLAGRCDEVMREPYGPWREAVRQLVASTDAGRLRRLPARARQHLAHIVPELAARRPSGEVAAGTAQPEPFEAFATVLTELTEGRPLIVVCDDAQWADVASVRLVGYLTTLSAPLVVLMTFRDIETPPDHPLSALLADLRRRRVVERIDLGGLDRDETAQLASARAHTDVPSDFVDSLIEQTAGNPFFVEEVVEELIAGGRPIEEWAAGRLGSVPEAVRDVLSRRLSSLGDETKDVLTVGAVIGLEFDAGIVEAVLETTDAGRALAGAIDARLLLEVGVDRFEFPHALVRRSLLEALTFSRRVRLHNAIGEHIASTRAEEDHLPELSYHFFEGVEDGDADRAIDYAVRAGDRAIELGADIEALAHFDRAATVLDRRGEFDGMRRCEVLGRRSMARERTGDLWKALDDAEAAISIARAAGESGRALTIALAFGPIMLDDMGNDENIALVERINALQALALEATEGDRTRSRAHALLQAGLASQDVERRKRLHSEAREIATALDDRYVVSYVDYIDSLWERCVNDPDIDRLVADLDEMYGFVEGYDAPRSLIAHAERAIAVRRGDRGRADDVLARMNAARLEARGGQLGGRTTSHWFSSHESRMTLCELLAQGRVEEAWRFTRELVEEGTRLGAIGRGKPRDTIFDELVGLVLVERDEVDRVAGTLGRIVDEGRIASDWSARLAYLRAVQGDAEGARAAIEAASEPGYPWVFIPRCLAEAAARIGDATTAERMLAWLRPFGGQLLVFHSAFQSVEASADRAIAQCLSTLGSHDEAIEAYERAIELEEGYGAHLLAQHTRHWLARSLRAVGESERARRVAEECLANASRLGLKLVEREIRELVAGW